ncbi:MAG: Arm DNA-binding domain-containing protein [Oscillibacter sp.]|nr:Arm DNA-binding domain-containing protein [Oscillibacter sp.]
MMCRKCRKEIPDDSRFCAYCGVRQDTRRNHKSRGNGQGSVYQLPNGKWIAVRTVGYEIELDGKRGRRITRSKSGFKTKREAVNALASIGTDRRPPVTTFWELYERWLPTHKASKSTMDCYRQRLNTFSPSTPLKYPTSPWTTYRSVWTSVPRENGLSRT